MTRSAPAFVMRMTSSAAHASGADQAMRHLLELSHRRIAQITGPRGWLATEDRRRGYQAALVGTALHTGVLGPADLSRRS